MSCIVINPNPFAWSAKIHQYDRKSRCQLCYMQPPYHCLLPCYLHRRPKAWGLRERVVSVKWSFIWKIPSNALKAYWALPEGRNTHIHRSCQSWIESSSRRLSWLASIFRVRVSHHILFNFFSLIHCTEGLPRSLEQSSVKVNPTW